MKAVSKKSILLVSLFVFSFLLTAVVHGQDISWNIETIETSAHLRESRPSLAFDANGWPAIAYTKGTQGGVLARLSPIGWIKTEFLLASVNPQKLDLKFDTYGLPGIAYGRSNGDAHVNYRHFDGQNWHDVHLSGGFVGPDSSLAYQYNGNPAVVHMGFQYVFYHEYDGVAWKKVNLESGPYPCLVFLPNGEPAIAKGGNNLQYVFRNGSTWTYMTVDTAPVYALSLALQSNGLPAIAYEDYTNKDLKFASYDGSQWTITTLDSNGDVGGSPSLAFDQNGLPGISYIDATNRLIKYAYFDGEWNFSTVGSFVAAYTGLGRFFTSLAFSPEGIPAIAYRTNSSSVVKFATAVYTAPPISGEEKQSSVNSLVEDVSVQNAVLSGVSVSGDISSTLDFTEFEMVTISTGPFAGKGFSKGKWETTLNGIPYEGEWQGFIFYEFNERNIVLKGAVSGGISAAVEGHITESIPDSGVYDKYQATWKIGKFGTTVASATINLDGILTYNNEYQFPDTELYALQTSLEGTSEDSSFDFVLTHVRVASETNPYFGQGFSIISYISNGGSGEGWTYDKVGLPGVVSLNGLFSDPMFGIASATLNENDSPRSFSLRISRVDLGLPPSHDLNIKTWGPMSISPGQTINYIIEYGNNGLKTADDTVIFYSLDPQLKYISASQGADYDEIFNSVSWNLMNVLPKTSGLLSIKVEVPWGLPGHSILSNSAYFVDVYTGEVENQNMLAPCTGNLFLNGIGLNLDPKDHYYKKLEKFANEKKAEWIKVYPGGLGEGKEAVDAATPGNDGEVEPSNENGLTKVINGCYDTCYGYSGGTRTLVTAMRLPQFNLKCRKVVLISPIKGSDSVISEDDYRRELTHMLEGLPFGGVEEIEIWQNRCDNFPLNIGSDYQFKIDLTDIYFARWWQKDITTGPNVGRTIGSLINVHDERIFCVRHDKWIQHLNGEDFRNAVFAFFHEVFAAGDPNMKYGPDGYVSAGQKLDYKVEYSNEGEGIAFGVYFTDTLDEDLDASTLEVGPVISTADGSIIAPAGIYNPATRAITWLIGEVGPGQGGYANLNVNVKGDAPDGSEIINYATVYFPSVPETTRTNGIVSIVGQDVDGDGIIDSMDNCPSVVNQDQIDSDSDGVGDACDACPNDSNKIQPGICGCGVADTDTDNDGTTDCNDGCPNDPNKINPGICGCGLPDVDSDSDGLLDCNDNCPNMYNPDQADINNNGIGNICEPDTTLPVIDISGCPQAAHLEAVASITVSVSDSDSGVASQSVPNGTNVLDTSTVGTKTLTVTAQDNRGNAGSNSCTYQVIYDFIGAGGFQPPVDDLPVTNTAKAGSSIPVKWQLPDGRGSYVSNLGAVTSIQFQQVACANFSDTLTDPVETTATGGTGLRYDFIADQYVYNWQTLKTQVGKCYTLTLKLNDGSLYRANFSLK